MKILVTRPRADAEELSKLLEARGHEALIEPLLDIVTLPGEPIAADSVQALIFTSANGVRALVERNGGDIYPLRALPVYTVGDATARAASGAGFTAVVSAAGDVKSLVALIAARVRPDIGPLLHVAGSDVAGDLAASLGEQGFTVERAVLYEAKTAESLSSETVDALKRGEVQAALFYSPRTAKAFVALAGDIAPALGRTAAICLSPAVAEAIEDLPGAASWRDILTAAEPTQDSLLSALDRFVERDTRPKGPASAQEAAAPEEAPASQSASADEIPESPLPPPIFNNSYGDDFKPSAPPDRPSWQSRAALGVVGLLVIGGIAVYLAKPAALQQFLAFEWLKKPAESLKPQPAPQAPAPVAEAPAPALSNDAPLSDAEVVDKLRQELAMTTARLREAEREPPIARPYETPPESAEAAPEPNAPAEPSPELIARLDGLEDKLGRLADRPTVAPDTLRYATDAFSQRLTRLDETLSALTQKLESQSAAQEAERARVARAEATAFGALALRQSLDRGTPFAEALPGLKPVAAEMGLAAQADLVAPAAASGLVAAEDLRARLVKLAEEVARAEAGPPDSGLFARIWRSLTANVVIRRVADDTAALNADDPADRLLSRAERRLTAGDLDGAVAPVELLIRRESLSPTLRQSLEDWLAQTRARRAAEQLANALAQRGLMRPAAAPAGAPR